ncbi:hypothetical protein, unlikely [Trypanosoma brucei gambiense DAL972]|uniref:Uncharacterized protein n=1 Tax=Trypanosoma brucei gambiense (strain MHOM/CI/86/DAL972) TaxID=679716 RepID=C9ZTI4_TRYB9|nr:hypothetical protein, unlikely [Trypanosoma brucei gambiense DAL972]CBH12719.1 hypothetical protein, unlikely [Trypanosoma brucei gambiense DAL972]|eukprot:XP_011774999.1 hypothetical protein, unlikely [Trypanosoma brucei gambiense DAL972]
MLRVIVVIINSFRFVCFLVLLMVLIYKLLIIINFFFRGFVFSLCLFSRLPSFYFLSVSTRLNVTFTFSTFCVFFCFLFLLLTKKKQKMSNNNTHKKKEK